MSRVGIVVAQLGGPTCADEVKPFIRAIFADPNLVPLPGGQRTRSLVSVAVATVRAPRSRSHYLAIGGGSPIVATTERQAEALRTELLGRGHDVAVAVAQRHGRPDTAAAVSQLMSNGVDRVVMLPLFAQYSGTTTGSSELELRRVLRARGLESSLRVVRSWCDHPKYLELQARLVDQMLDDISPESLDRGLLVFSAHGLPRSIVDRGDPYPEEVGSSVAGIVDRLTRPVAHKIAYQSRAGPMRWLGPDVRDVLSRAGEQRLEWVGVVPISFVSEHVETLYEIDIELREHALSAGVREFRRSSCLEIKPGVGSMLADIVEGYL